MNGIVISYYSKVTLKKLGEYVQWLENNQALNIDNFATEARWTQSGKRNNSGFGVTMKSKCVISIEQIKL